MNWPFFRNVNTKHSGLFWKSQKHSDEILKCNALSVIEMILGNSSFNLPLIFVYFFNCSIYDFEYAL